MRIYSLLLLPLLFLTSCATITRGVHEKLRIESDPSGANVVLSTGEKGITPATFVEKRRDSFTVTVSKPGYAAQTVTVKSKAGGTGATAMAGNVLLGGAIGMGVDAGTGAYNSLYPNPVSVIWCQHRNQRHRSDRPLLCLKKNRAQNRQRLKQRVEPRRK